MRVIGTVLYGVPGLVILAVCFVELRDGYDRLISHPKESWGFYLLMGLGFALLSRAAWIFLDQK